MSKPSHLDPTTPPTTDPLPDATEPGPTGLTRRQLLVGAAAALGGLFLPAAAFGEEPSRVVDAYEGKRGVTLKLELEAAPFPGPGGRWQDRTTMVFVPHHFRMAGSSVDLVVHFHGHHATAEGAMKEHQLREQFYESRQNAILIMPQGPVRAASSAGGKLDKEGGLLDFLTDLRKTLQSREARRALGPSHIGRKARVGMLCLSGHSGAYRVIARCITHGGFNVNEVYLFDALYGDAHLYADWLVSRKTASGRDRHKLISYYAGGRVAEHNRALMSALDRAEIPYHHETREGTLSRAELTLSDAVFIRTRVGHGDVTHQYNNLRDCLYASCLKRRLKSDWFANKHDQRPLERFEAE